MFAITLAPILALTIDYLKRRLKVSKTLVFIVFAILTIPTFVIWTGGFDFSNQILYWIAVTIILTLCCFIILTILNNKFKIKLILAIIMTIPILVIAFLGALGGEYGGGQREVLNKSTFMNYVAYELEPKMYENYNTLIVDKTMFSNFISKTIYETTFTDSSKKFVCDTYVTDNKTQLKYDLCNHKLSIR